MSIVLVEETEAELQLKENKLTIEKLQELLPKGASNSLKPAVIRNITAVLEDQDIRENYRENLLSYAGIMSSSNHSVKSYVEAVKFITYRLLDDSLLTAYMKTFPDRYQQMLDDNYNTKDMWSRATVYNRGKLVQTVYEQTIIPSYVLNADIHQKAINVQADLMINANSEKVRSDAANSLLTHLKPPEAAKLEIEVGIKESDGIKDLRDAIVGLAKQQTEGLNRGFNTAKEIADSNIVAIQPPEPEPEDDTNFI